MTVLPIVSKGTIESVAQAIVSNELFLTDICKEITEDNPEIAILIGELIKLTGNQKPILITAAAIYKLLKSQAEADNLKKDFLLE